MSNGEIVYDASPELVGEAERQFGLPAQPLQFQQSCGRQDHTPNVLQIFIADAERIDHRLGVSRLRAVFGIESQAKGWNSRGRTDALPEFGSLFHLQKHCSSQIRED